MYWFCKAFCAMTAALAACSTTFALPPEGFPPASEEIGAFVPNAGYLRNTRRLQLRRRAAAANMAIPAGPGQQLSVRGTRSIPVLCVAFDNVDGPFPSADYQRMLFGADDRTLTAYYNDASEGLFAPTGEVLGWYKAPKKDVYYESANNGLGGARMGELLKFAFTKADADVDFGEFDNDGPDGEPNSGDDDGVVDTVFLIHPEIGGECEKAGQMRNIWSHSWHYSEGLGHSEAFVTVDPVKDEAGTAVPNAFVQIDDYTVQPGLACSSSTTTKKRIEVGVFCHEYGHALGLPDLYDRTPSDNPDSAGIGNWCLMAGGSYGGDGKHADRPCEMSAWCKYYLGWATAKPLIAAMFDFKPVDDGNHFYRFDVPGTDRLEYFLIEYRRKAVWDEFLPDAGLAIWHIDERVGEASDIWPFADHDEGQNDAPNKVSSTPPQIENPHQLVALVQADGAMELEKGANRGKAGDLFAAGAFEHDPSGVKGSQAYSGAPTTLAISDIAVSANQVKAKVEFAATPPAASGVAAAGPVADANTVAAAAQPPLSRTTRTKSPQAQLAEDQAKQYHRQLAESAGDYMIADIESLRKLPSHAIEALPSGEAKQRLIEQAAKSRTTSLASAISIPDTIGSAIKEHLPAAEDQSSTVVRLSPSGDKIETLANLSVPIGDASPAEDAKSRLEGDWKPLFGDAQFVQASVGAGAPSPRQVFHEVVTVDDKQLRVFGKGCTFHYADGELKGVTADLAESPPAVTGAADTLDSDQGKKIVAAVLGTPEKLIKGGREGVYLLNDDPNQGRIVRRYLVPVGPKQKDLEVFLDEATEQILSIE